MPRVLYEASYIGNPKSFSFYIVDAIRAIMLLVLVIVAIYTLKKERGEKEEYCGNKSKEYSGYALKHFFLTVFALFGGVFGWLYLVETILGYNEDILGYKRGEYREVEGFVEDYTDSKRHTFTVNGVEFEVSAFVQTWGYTYGKSDQNVITGDGQHLKIRYMPHSSGSNIIVYIEEIGPPLTQPDVKQEEIEEPAVPIDQIGIQGRTEEETELIQKILSQDKKEFQKFLMAYGLYPHMGMIWISAYDLTGDGIDELIVSKYYKDMSAELTYNYVYDQTGKRVLEFVGGDDTQIIDGWDGDGTFLLYDRNDYFKAPHYFTNTYTEIRCEDDVLTEKVILVELDRRPIGDYGEEEYYIFTDFTKEEEEKLWEGGLGVNELTETKAYVREDKRVDEYKQLFRESETTGFSRIAMIRYSDSDGFQEYTEEY